MWSSRVGKWICLFDMLNRYIVCPDSGSVRTAQMNNIVSASVRPWTFFIRSESRIMGW